MSSPPVLRTGAERRRGMMGLVGSVLRLLLARVALKEAASRAARLVVLLLLASVLLAAAIAFGLYAIYAWLAMHFTPPQAAGMCAGALLLLAGIVVAIASWRPRRRVSRPPDRFRRPCGRCASRRSDQPSQ